MLKIYDYQCQRTNEVYERLSRDGADEVCTCGAVSKRLISPIKCQLDNSFPGYASKWAREHEIGGTGRAVK